ncbi:glycosyltransferase family 2 protein [Thiocapsa rosea]|uniref:Glycosyl transferase family 2 n=1 Tax=Thiocapsa rosea TaxID=69360 RepID=A0A495V501_9GAMM|nr:glycosyltransferase family A protein [Thiocapsa rosea]RKT44481.1 glycosyl transferase family 2 [Thiocapsa rosea]
MNCIPDAVSVVIPLYNHRRYIEEALESALAQTRPALEIIVVDDGSTDDSASLAEAMARRYPDSILVWSQPNQGAHSALNAGIARARGEYIAILNSDDAWHPDRLRQCSDAIGDAAAVATAIEFFDGTGASVTDAWYREARGFFDVCHDLPLALINGNFIMTTSNLFARRAAIMDVGGFSNLRYAHDLDLFLSLLVNDGELKLHDAPLLRYRRHDANTISEDVLSMKAEWAMVTAAYVWRLMQRRKIDWSWYAKLTEICDKHGLTRMLIPAMAFLSSLPGEKQTCNALYGHDDFARFFRGTSR